MSQKEIRISVIAGISAVAAAILLFVSVLSFGSVGRYSYAESVCATDPSAARQALSSVPDSYKDTELFKQYVDALAAAENKDYDNAEEILERLDYYRDCRVIVKDVYYSKALALREKGLFDEAMEYFKKSGSEDGEEQIRVTEYNAASAEYEKGNYLAATEAFKELGDYSDSVRRYLQSKLMYAKTRLEEGHTKEAAKDAEEIISHENGEDFAAEASAVILKYAEALMAEEDWDGALIQLKKCDAYEDAAVISEKTLYCNNMITYNEAVSLMEAEEYAQAVAKFDLIPGFLDADELNADCEKKAFSWSFTGYLSKDGTENRKTTSFYRSDTIYFYGTLTGGKPGRNVTLLFTWVDCVGLTETVRVTDWTDGSSGGVTFSYSNPKNANFGKSSITVYIEETGEQLAKYNFTVKK